MESTTTNQRLKQEPMRGRSSKDERHIYRIICIMRAEAKSVVETETNRGVKQNPISE